MTETKPDPVEPPPAVRRHSRWMIVMILITMVAFFMGFPTFYLSLLTAPAAIVFGILTLVASWGLSDMLAVRINVVVGMALAGMGLLIGLGGLLMYDVLAAQQECQARAVTQTAERACMDQYEEDYRELLDRYGVSVPE